MSENTNPPIELLKAAEMGVLEAQAELAAFYYDLDDPDYENAHRWFAEAAKAGDSHCQCMLGYNYLLGEGTGQDLGKAFQWFLKSALNGDVDGMSQTGQAYIDGSGIPQDYEEGERWLRAAVALGSLTAMRALGAHYIEGDGIEGGIMDGVNLVEMAAEKGDIFAQALLSRLYREGEHLPSSPEAAARWARSSAEGGAFVGMIELAKLYEEGFGVEQSIPECRNLLARAAESGVTMAVLEFADHLLEYPTTDVDVETGFDLLRMAAEEGDAAAQFDLAVCHQIGYGVEEDEYESFFWLKLAHANGYEPARWYLGQFYHRGIGTPIDVDRARPLFEAGVEEGCAESMSSLAALLLDWYKIETETDIPRGVALARMAAELGDPQGLYMVGVMLRDGEFMPTDEIAALMWFRRAAERGHIEAQLALAQMHEVGCGTAKDPAKALELYREAAEVGDGLAKDKVAELEALLNGTAGIASVQPAPVEDEETLREQRRERMRKLIATHLPNRAKETDATAE